MANPQNEALVKRTLDFLNQPQLPADFERTFGPDWDNHALAYFQGQKGPQGFRQLHDFWHKPFSNFKVTLERMFSDGDYVAAYFRLQGTHTKEFMGVAPTGKHFDISATGIWRCENGRLAEAWVNPDRFALMQQLSIHQIPEMPQRRAA